MWNTSYVINFTLPFYAIGRSEGQDKRILHGNEPFRTRFELGSFSREELLPILANTEDLKPQESLVLHQGVYSFSATGVTEEHWTAYCFEDEFFESEQRALGKGEDVVGTETCVDPIMVEVDVRDTATQWRPRQYSLAALAKRLDKVHGHHTLVHEMLKHILDTYVSVSSHRVLTLFLSLLETVMTWYLANVSAET